MVTYDGLQDGDYVFQVRAHDGAGNEGGVVSREWTVDSTATSESWQVASGGTVAPSAPSAGDPVATAITSPNAGSVTVADAATTTAAPSGYTLLGRQVTITAPAGTADAPLRLVFRIDGSALAGGVNETNLVVFRNGVAAAPCAANDGRAIPTPCVAQRRRLDDGDVEATVLTVQASTWNFGRANTPPAAPSDAPRNDPPVGPRPTLPPPPGPPREAPPRIAISFPSGVKLLPSLKNGFVVSGTTSAAAKIAATVTVPAATAKKLKLGAKAVVVGRADGQFGAGGFSLNFKPAAKYRKKLAKARKLSLLLTGTATGTGGTTSFTQSIALRR